MKNKFKRFSNIDYTVLLILVLIWIGLCYVNHTYVPSKYTYITSLLIITTLSSFAVYLVRKIGTATLFYTVGAAMTSNFNGLGLLGLDKIVSFFIVGIIFDSILFFTKTEKKIPTIDVTIGAIVSAALIPVISSYVLTGTIIEGIGLPLLNLVLLSFLVSFVGSLIGLEIWKLLRVNKTFLKFEFEN